MLPLFSGAQNAVSSVPILSVALGIAKEIARRCASLSTHHTELTALGIRCNHIVVELRERSEGLRSHGVHSALNHAVDVLRTISEGCHSWQRSKPWKKVVSDDKIAQDLKTFNTELDRCMDQFSIAILMEILQTTSTLPVALPRLVAQGDTMVALLRQIAAREVSTDDTQLLMKSVQNQISSPPTTATHAERAALKQALGSLSQTSGQLPPSVDLQGQVDEQSLQYPGNTSDVYKATWLGHIVAVKYLRDPKPAQSRVEKFKHEGILWRTLNHPNVVPFYGIVRQPQGLGLVYAWLDNRDAMTFVKEYPDCDRRAILRGTAAGIAYLHNQAVVHGDIRGCNILIDPYGQPKISEFGLAAASTSDHQLVFEGMSAALSSTVARWMPPERCQAGEEESRPTAEGDVYSFGRTMLEIMTGEKPFATEKNVWAIANGLMAGLNPPRPLSKEVIERGLTDGVWGLMLWMWALDMKKRPTMAQVVAELNELMPF